MIIDSVSALQTLIGNLYNKRLNTRDKKIIIHFNVNELFWGQVHNIIKNHIQRNWKYFLEYESQLRDENAYTKVLRLLNSAL